MLPAAERRNPSASRGKRRSLLPAGPRAGRKHTSKKRLVRETRPKCLSLRAGEPELLELRVFFCLPTSRGSRGKTLYFFSFFSPPNLSPLLAVSPEGQEGPRDPLKATSTSKSAWAGWECLPSHPRSLTGIFPGEQVREGPSSRRPFRNTVNL